MTVQTPDDAPTAFGPPMRQHFLMAPNYRNLNHGSYGTIPRQIQAQQRAYQDEAESCPDRFMRLTGPAYTDESRSALSKLLRVPRSELVFVRNATTGVNVVLRNLVYEPGDVILYFATTYGACAKTVESLGETTAVVGREVGYELPATHGELVRKFEETVGRVRGEGLRVRAALIDTIVSQPGVRFPFERVVESCRRLGVLSVVDGAHGVGHIPFDLGALDADFFVSNCHKWLYCPRGCAVLHVPLRNQHLIRTTLPTSWGFHPQSQSQSPEPPATPTTKSPFELLFEHTATDDTTAYMCIPAALSFRQRICGGEDAITSYLQDLAFTGGNAAAERLGTDVMTEPGTDWRVPGVSRLRRCGFAVVRLPIGVVDEGDEGEGEAAGARYPVVRKGEAGEVSAWLDRELRERHNAFIPSVVHGGWVWVRLSAQTYLAREDFEWAGDVLRDVCGRFGKSELCGKLAIQGKGRGKEEAN